MFKPEFLPLVHLGWTTKLLKEREKERVLTEVDLLVPLVMNRPIQLGFTSRLWCSSCFSRSIYTRAHRRTYIQTPAQCHSAVRFTHSARTLRVYASGICRHSVSPYQAIDGVALLDSRQELFQLQIFPPCSVLWSRLSRVWQNVEEWKMCPLIMKASVTSSES